MSGEQVKQGYKRTEVGVIPEDWEATALKNVTLDMVQGVNTAIDRPEYVQDGIPMLKANNVIDEEVIFEGADHISRKTFSGYKDRFILKKNDFLFSNIGARLGTGSLLRVDIECSFAWNVMRIVPDTRKINPDYFNYFINSPKFSQEIRGMQSGSGMGFVPKGVMQNACIAMPSLLEQCDIATVLSDVNALLNKLDQLIAKKHDLKQATMQQLLTGQTRLPGFSGEWEVKRLGDVVEIRKGQLITERDAIHGDIPVIAGGKKPSYFHNRPNRVGKTITVSASGASAGYVAFFDSPIFASDCSTISDVKTYSIEFIYFQLLLKQDEIYLAQTGGAQPHIHAVDLMPLEVGMCSLEEQAAIANVLSDMDAELASLESRRDKTRALKQGMMQELLTGRIRLISAEEGGAK